MIWILSRQKRDIDRLLQSNGSVSRTNYYRIFALASIDVMLTLPIGVVTITLLVKGDMAERSHLPFYRGWSIVHSGWEPEGFTYAYAQASGTSALAADYFSRWTSPVLAFAIFGLFGITKEARASYWRVICTIGSWFSWKPKPHAHGAGSALGTMEFGTGPRGSIDLEIGFVARRWALYLS